MSHPQTYDAPQQQAVRQVTAEKNFWPAGEAGLPADLVRLRARGLPVTNGNPALAWAHEVGYALCASTIISTR